MRGCSSVRCDRFVSYNFFGASDKLAQNMSLYVEFYEYVEVYDGVWGVLLCNCVYFGRSCL